MSPMVEGEVERAKRKRATVIVTRWIRITRTLIPNNTHFLTSGALTFVVLAAALVTASFLMSPVIEDVFGRQHMRNYRQLIKMKWEEIVSRSKLF